MLVAGATRGWYLPSGHLVYGTKEGALFAVLDGIETSTTFTLAKAAFSASGTVAYLPGGAQTSAVIVQLDRTGHEEVVVAKPGSYAHLRLSPDGRRLALDALDAKGVAQVWIHDRASVTTRQLTFDGTSVRQAWSPDGNRVAFSAQRGNRWNVRWAPADGSGPGERAGEGPEVNGSTAVSWTRDGKWIAYNSDDAGKYQVYIRPFPAPGGRTLISAGRASEAVWLSNTELVYLNNEGDSLTLAHLEFGPTITVTRTALFDARNYMKGSESSRNYDVSQDGKHFIFVKPIAGKAAAGIK